MTKNLGNAEPSAPAKETVVSRFPFRPEVEALGDRIRGNPTMRRGSFKRLCYRRSGFWFSDRYSFQRASSQNQNAVPSTRPFGVGVVRPRLSLRPPSTETPLLSFPELLVARAMIGLGVAGSLMAGLKAIVTWFPRERVALANGWMIMLGSFGAVTAGKGATYAWQGDGNVGEGRMEIVEATPPGKVLIKLDFIKPFEGHNTAEFTMLPQGGATTVSWVMTGPTPLMAKVMHVFINMDRMIGKDFEAGLVNLKRLAEM